MFMKCQPTDALEQLESYKDLKDPEKFTLIEMKLYQMFESMLLNFHYIGH